MSDTPAMHVGGLKATDLESPFGRFAIDTHLPARPGYEAPEGFLEAAGCIVGSYTLEDRTVFVFEHLTMEVFRGGDLYAFSFPKSTP